ncbi:MAG: hypothetical protein ACI9JN_000217 [Bacteroidia bacterium]|jgi:hypothetical protein
MKNPVALLVITFALFTTISCGEKSSQSSSILAKPQAKGEVGKVVMMINDATYVHCKDAIKEVYQKPIEGMPGNEGYFKINHCNEDGFTNFFKHNFNLCFVYQQDNKAKIIALMGSSLTDMLDEKLAKGQNFFVAKNLFAVPQEVSFVLGKDNDAIKASFLEHKDKILTLALATERKTTIDIVIRDPVEDDVFYNEMLKDYGYAIRTPANFKRSVRSQEFNGINRIFGEKRSGIYMYDEAYTGEEQFTEAYIINRRNSILRNHLHGPDRIDSIPTYVTTDTVNVEVFSKEIKLNGYRAIETRGWWEMENEFFAGPFVSYTIYCPELKKVVTIEGNVFAPSKKKQPLLRVIELAATTFKAQK